jgi:hypothetical protein
MQREYQLETATDRRGHSHPELERRIVSIIDHSQKKEYSHPEVEREIVSIRIITKENSQKTEHPHSELWQEVIDLSYRQQSEESTYKLEYKRKLLVLARDNSQEKKTLASWIAEKDCCHQLKA